MATEVAVILEFATLASAAHESRKHGRRRAEILGGKECRDREDVVSLLMAALGPDGPGLVAVRGVPQYENLREELLPMARKLALMPQPEQNDLLKDNGLGTDVPLKTPNRPVSSFAAQLQFQGPQLLDLWGGEDSPSIHKSPEEDDCKNNRHVGRIFRHLGLCMVKVGLLVASLCDLVVDGAELEKTILSSGTAKGRLIHYHALGEEHILSGLPRFKHAKGNAAKRSLRVSLGGTKGSAHKDGRQEESKPAQEWQDWHLDYGVFTVLTAPLFCKLATPKEENGDIQSRALAETCPSPCGHSLLRILHGPSRSLKFMDIPPDCLVIQVGEAAQILSGGKLRATAHCVCRPPGGELDICRETFAVFLQPSWDKELLPPLGCDETVVLQGNAEFGGQVEMVAASNTSPVNLSVLNEAIPPLSSRWTQGCTFAEFSRSTTRQYYGAAGRQHIPSSSC